MAARSSKRKATDRCSPSQVPAAPLLAPSRSSSRFSTRSPIKRHLYASIGVHTGDALHEADRFFGTTVHYAARVAGNALGGEILVSSVVRDLVAGGLDVTFLEEREVQLKGIEGFHRLFAVDLA